MHKNIIIESDITYLRLSSSILHTTVKILKTYLGKYELVFAIMKFHVILLMVFLLVLIVSANNVKGESEYQRICK